MRVDWSTYHVFRQLSIDDEPSTLGTYTASDAAGELPYSREGVLSSLVSMVWSITGVGWRMAMVKEDIGGLSPSSCL